jgi:hypothetical protein
MNERREFILVSQVLAIVSFSITTTGLFNAGYLYLFQRANDTNSTSLISLAIMFIFLGDSLGTGGYLSEYRPPTGSIDCSVTGFLHLTGYMITWTFTFYISYIIYSVAVWERMPMNVVRDFALGLGIPIVLISIQAGFFGFAQYKSADYDVCFPALHNQKQIIYHLCSFWGILFAVFIAMIVLRGHEYWLELNNDPRIQSSLFSVSKSMLQYYPIILLFCWIPSIVETSQGTQTPQWFHLFATVTRISHGILIGAIYFILGDQSRQYFWKALNPLAWTVLLIGSGNDSVGLLHESFLQCRDSTMEMIKSESSVLSKHVNGV